MPRLSALLAGLWILPSLAATQDRPFVFHATTAARDYALRATCACRF